ncbi:MAG TPA: 50S ribosomal protein L11 methyltransferase [Oxalicibacterium sp.]|uniref:50S ribosomal protein L11 methyltransferase n=1 Tax=Oxalicibacterium sp. TaxID=2766525 RepID=UPI002B879767|nr:50S ribosomal protein L11 methyltransferase [Oxalicibacterium sp.]HWU98028.1 50S ribosomal protein L11 methyltransferase [Oxalicibacterium sp.]
MSWTEIVIEVARTHAEALSDALIDAGALSVSVEDADFGTDAEQPLFGEPGMEPEEKAWEHSRVVALTPVEADQNAIVAEAAKTVGLSASNITFSLRPVEEQDWVRLTQSQFEPIHIGKNIWVVPSWHDAPDPDALVLELDPGLAFGTGSHPTTRLCMEWLEAHPSNGTVLDYGCGSGILAMVAKKLGAEEVIGIDIDPQAIEAARDNTERNRCEVAYYVPDDFAVSGHVHTFDVVVANILANPLKLMAPMLSGRVNPGGMLVLSGVLATQADEVIAVYAPFITLTVWKELEGWVALAGQLTSSASATVTG